MQLLGRELCESVERGTIFSLCRLCLRWAVIPRLEQYAGASLSSREKFFGLLPWYNTRRTTRTATAGNSWSFPSCSGTTGTVAEIMKGAAEWCILVAMVTSCQRKDGARYTLDGKRRTVDIVFLDWLNVVEKELRRFPIPAIDFEVRAYPPEESGDSGAAPKIVAESGPYGASSSAFLGGSVRATGALIGSHQELVV